MRAAAPKVRTPQAAIALGSMLLARAREEGLPWAAASILEARAVILGAAQRAGQVVDMAACAQGGIELLRRTTTGTAAYLDGRAILWQLALPHLSALIPDASPRTLLNRHIRGFLRGFTRAGAASHYFGREWIAIRQRPTAIVGFDVEPDGGVLIELCAGYDQPIALPKLIAAPPERAVDRWLGKTPAALGELIPARDPIDLSACVIQSIASTSGRSIEMESIAEQELAGSPQVHRSDDPVPEGLVIAEPVRVPIGWLEAAAAPAGSSEPRRAWLGGDVLVPRHVLAAVARAVLAADSHALAALERAPIEGAVHADLCRAVERAAAAGGAGARG